MCTDYKKIKYVNSYLLDNFNLKTGQLGGTRLTHDWNKNKELIKKLDKLVFSSFGLNTNDIKQAISVVRLRF